MTEVTPNEVTATSVMQREVSFSWGRPPCSFQTGAAAGFSYVLVEVRSGATLNQSHTTSTSLTLGGLVPFTNYSFQVALATDVGALPFSDRIFVETQEAGMFCPNRLLSSGVQAQMVNNSRVFYPQN